MTDRPYILAPDFDPEIGIPEMFRDIIQKHFNIVIFEEFKKNEKCLGPKIQLVFVWVHRPIISEELLLALPKLKGIVINGVGVDHLNLQMINSFGVKVTNLHVVEKATADIAMALLLGSARNLVQAHQLATSPDYKRMIWNWVGVEVTGATLGIIGMGRIGYKVAQRAKGFDMKILYHNRNRRKVEEETEVGASYCAKIDDLLQQSDFVLLLVNLNPDSHRLIGERELSLMLPTATLINVSRGAVVDQDALVKALQNDTIRAAALDVTDPEPLPRNHPLLKLPNVIITPHIGSATVDTRRDILDKMIENGLAVINETPVPDLVTL